MKVIYVFATSNASMLLEKMIIPQVGQERHGAEVVGMFFVADNVYLFLPENPIGEKLVQLASKYGFSLVCCDFCCEQRGISSRLYPGAQEGCFPDLYQLAEEKGAQQVITL
jgi:sulfur relay (sulfurtransferase) complex TusBCD TusD component (DsrE family)